MKDEPQPVLRSNEKPLSAWSAGDAEIVTASIADVCSTGMPLPQGLRAAAEEAPSDRLAADLRAIAAAAESGESLEDLFAHQINPRTRYLGALIAAAAASGDAPVVVAEMAELYQMQRDVWRSMRGAVAYPLVLILLTLTLALFMEFVLIRQMRGVYEDFGLELPGTTRMLLWLHGEGLWWLAGSAAAIAIVFIGIRVFGGATLWRRFISTVPLIGGLWHWSGVAEWSRLLAVLLEHRMPLPAALRLAGGGTHDANIGRISEKLANDVEDGRSLSHSIEATYRLPTTLVPLVRWGETSGELAEAFRMAGEMFEVRVIMRAQMLRSLFPPLIFVGVATFVIVVIVGLYAPLLTLIQWLT